jgi:ribosomal protein S13
MELDLISLLVIVLFSLLITYALREVICWYYKINERIKIQEENNKQLKRIADYLINSDNIKTVVEADEKENNSNLNDLINKLESNK